MPKRKNTYSSAALIFIIALLAVLGRSSNVGHSVSSSSENRPDESVGTVFEGKCVGVIDGDTIRVMHSGYEEKIRLFGVDAPEKSQPYGNAAKKFTSEMVFGKIVKVDVKDYDRYGRTVAKVIALNGKTLNSEIVRAGLAWWYERYAPYDNELQQLEQNAKNAKRGLWKEPNPTAPWDYREKQRNDID